MPNKEKRPKELLADQELIGFTRLLGRGDQMAQRASSAKVLSKSGLRDELAKAASQVRPSRPSGNSGL